MLYVNISQIFRIWVVPFHRSPVSFTTVLRLKHSRDDGKYYIQSQDDLYQVDQFVRFVLPPGWILIWIWHYWATFFCVVGTFVLWPISALEQWLWQEGQYERLGKREFVVDGNELEELDKNDMVKEGEWLAFAQGDASRSRDRYQL
jgi:hypothetical protein